MRATKATLAGAISPQNRAAVKGFKVILIVAGPNRPVVQGLTGGRELLVFAFAGGQRKLLTRHVQCRRMGRED